MDSQDLRKLLEQTKDKFNILADPKTLNQYDLTVKDFLDIISDFLSDEEKLKLFDYSHFQNFEDWIKFGIIGLISNPNTLQQVLFNDGISGNLQNYQIMDLIKKLDDNVKTQILYNQEFIQKHQIEDFHLKEILDSLGDSAKSQVLTDKTLTTDKLHLTDWQIAGIVKDLSDEKIKQELLSIYPFEVHQIVDIVSTFSNSTKLDFILQEKSFKKYDILIILSSLDVDSLSKFFIENKEFCSANAISPYEIVKSLNIDLQKEVVDRLEELNLTFNEKREVLAMLDPEVKQSIDTTNFPKEYLSAISMQKTGDERGILFDFEKDMEDYRGLDNLLLINPQGFSKDQRSKLMQLCDICPNSKIYNTINDVLECYSTTSEYKTAEEWISSIIDNLKPEYSKAQKMAVIDNAIGKKISYSPDFDTEVFDTRDCRALWKIISSGYGICNGIANVEKYIFSRVGIESKIISGGNHAFLKIEDIELPLSNGETAKGNTIIDPTWDLTRYKLGGRPDNFCMSYAHARKNDIDAEGLDHNCHKNDKELSDATLDLDDASLRQLFKSVGLTDKDGQFLIKPVVENSQALHQLYANEPSKNIESQFKLLYQACPDFATCQNSSMSLINLLLSNENLQFNKCVINRVYDRKDAEKRPVLYVYVDSDGLGQKFYFARKDDNQFTELQQKEFIQQFECYEEDLNKHNGIRPWETKEKEKENLDLSSSSGEIVAKEGEER